MGTFDTVLFVDLIDAVRCPSGHALRWFQTKDLPEPRMQTYLVRHGRLYRAEPAGAWAEPAGPWAEPAGPWAEPAGAWAEPAGAWAEPAGAWAEPAGPWAEPAGPWAEPAGAWAENELRTRERIDADEAARQHRFELHEIRGPLTVRVYGSCTACDPVLVRTAQPGPWEDVVTAHDIVVDFRLTLRPDEAILVERTSGTRDDLKSELRRRGVYVLEDDEPLAVAHRALSRRTLQVL